MCFAIGNGDKGWKEAVVIQADMEFNGAFGGAEFGPGKDAQTQINSGGVQGENLVFKAKAMLWAAL